MDRALAYGFTTRRQVAVYVTLTLLLGSGFDADPMLPWAARCLGAREPTDPEGRTRKLQAAALRFLEAAEGARKQHLNAALDRLKSLPFEALLPEGGAAVPGYVAARLESFHPTKWAAVGPEITPRFIEATVAAARERGFVTPQGAALYAGLRFMLGAAFKVDPIVPWARSSVETALAAAPEARDRALHRAIVRHVSASPRSAR